MKKLFVILLIAGSFICNIPVFADDTAIKNEISALDQQISERKKELEGLQEQRRNKAEEISSTNDNINQVLKEIDDKELLLQDINKQLEAALAEEQAAYGDFSERLIAMYEQGDNTYLSLLLGSENLNDLIKRIGLIKDISASDREVYDYYHNNRKTIDDSKEELDNLKTELEKQNIELNNALTEKNTESDAIVQLINDKQREIDELEKERDKLQKKISSVEYADKLFAEAEKYLGMPYVFGGSTPETSFDCSGFVCYATTHSGVFNLPRTTAQGIYNQCIKISPSEAKRGDIIFFQGTYNAGETITHVGFYAGDGKMLHCGNPIQYANVNSQYWASHFYAYGRLKSQ